MSVECEWFEDEVTEVTAVTPPEEAAVLTDVRIYDYKDGSCHVNVVHRDDDPSRIWLAFEKSGVLLRVSLEEGSARQLLEGLRFTFGRFLSVRRPTHSPLAKSR